MSAIIDFLQFKAEKMDAEYRRLSGDVLRSALNTRQRLVVLCLAHLRAQHGKTAHASIDALAKYIGVSVKTTWKHVKVLKRLGYCVVNGDLVAITDPEARKAML